MLPTLDELIAWPFSLHGIAWPAENSVRTADLSSLVGNGFTTTILSGDNTNAADLTTTPSAVLPITGGKALAADAGISSALRDAATATDDTTWNAAMSKVNAQLGLVSEDGGAQAQPGGDARSLLAVERHPAGTHLPRHPHLAVDQFGDASPDLVEHADPGPGG